MEREQGFYWVRHKGEWVIGRWAIDPNGDFGNVWLFAGDRAEPWSAYDPIWHDSDMEEIDERRLKRISIV